MRTRFGTVLGKRMLSRILVRYISCILVVILVLFSRSLSAQAANIDSYVRRYLHITEQITLDLDGQGNTKEFSPQQLSDGKQLFATNCINCHVGGATLPDPEVSLSLTKLKQATPPRDNINGLVVFMRQPMTYDGSEETYWCRQVAPRVLSQQQVENLAAFVLTAAKKAPGWGTEVFSN